MNNIDQFKEEAAKYGINTFSEKAFDFEVILNNNNKYRIPLEMGEWLQSQASQPHDSNESLIFGKDTTENIVSVDVKQDTVYIYQEIDGVVSHITKPMEYYLIASKKPSSPTLKLQGNQHYKYLMTFDSKYEWKEMSDKAYKHRVDCYRCYDDREAFMLRSGMTYFKGMKVQDVSVLSTDIETEALNPENGRVLLISNTFRKDGEVIRELFSIDEYDTEQDMLEAWCKWVRKMNPSVIIGHNLYAFDLTYLNGRYEINTGNSMPLGRDGSVITFADKPSKKRKDGSQSYDYYKVNIFGRELVDTFFLSLDYDVARNFPSYGLKPIIEYLGYEKEGRIKWDFENDKPKDIYENRHTEPEKWEAFKEYCVDDGDDSLKLYDLMISSWFYLNQSFPMSFQAMIERASGAQINSFMIRAYLQENMSIPKASDKVKFQGAISLGMPGVYQNVRKVDVASLYPSIMRQYKVYDPNKDPEKVFLRTVEYFTLERLKNKQIANETGDQYYRDLEQAQKIVINSMYGFLGASGLNFNSPANAAFVTEKGRDILQKGIQWACGNQAEQVQVLTKTGKVKKKQNSDDDQLKWTIPNMESSTKYVVPNVDTDSFSYARADGEKIPDDQFEKEIEEINTLYPELIVWEDDGGYETFVVIKAKNYIMKQGDKIKLKGSSLTDQKKEKILLELVNEICEELAKGNTDLVFLYDKYIKLALNPVDIKGWATKKTITKSVMQGTTTQQEKVWEACKDKPGIQEGDKVYLYTAQDGEKIKIVKGEPELKKDGTPKMVPNLILKLVEDYDNDHVAEHLLKRVYKTFEIFENLLDINQYPKYYTKKLYKELLERECSA